MHEIKNTLINIDPLTTLLSTTGGSLASVIVSFLFNFLYLLVGYWYTESDGYDICWTMPHCILALRLIGRKSIKMYMSTKRGGFKK